MSLIGIAGLAGSGKDTVADILVRDHGFAKVALADPIKRAVKELFAFTVEQLWGPSSARNAPDKRYPREHGPWTEDGKCMCCGVPNEPDIVHVQCYLTPRHALQQLGTEWGRRCYPNVWVDYTLRVANALLADVVGGRAHDYDKYRKQNYHPQVGLFDRAGNDDEASHGDRINGVVISDVRFHNEVAAIRSKQGQTWLTSYGSGIAGVVGQHESEIHIANLIVDAEVPPSPLEDLPAVVARILEEHPGPFGCSRGPGP
jgi:hypothetical protein